MRYTALAFLVLLHCAHNNVVKLTNACSTAADCYPGQICSSDQTCVDGTPQGSSTQGVASPSASTMTAQPATVAADGTSTAAITVTLLDGRGRVLSGKTVSVASNRGLSDAIAPGSAATNAQGIATLTVASTAAGSAVLAATDTTDAVAIAETASITFTSDPPSGLSYLVTSADYPSTYVIVPNSPTLATGAGVTYTVTPELPTGLRLDPATGIISGTPIVPMASATYTVSATNVFGSTQAQLQIAVLAACTGQCAAPVPGGWNGPVVGTTAATPGVCTATAFPTQATFNGSATVASALPLTIPSPSCSCSCGAHCGFDDKRYTIGSACTGSFGGWSGAAGNELTGQSCYDYASFGNGAGPVEISNLAGYCYPTQRGTPKPAVSWAGSIQLCGGATTAATGACPATDSCYPPAPSGFAAAACVWSAGLSSCPSGSAYSVQTQYYSGLIDSRGCTACTCAASAVPACGNFSCTLYASPNCTGAATSPDCTNQCLTATWGSFMTAFTEDDTGSCTGAPSASSPTGSVAADPTTAVTVCCMP